MFFNSHYCRTNCLKGGQPAIISGIVNIPDTPVYKNIDGVPDHELDKLTPIQTLPSVIKAKKIDIAIIEAVSFNYLSKKRTCQITAISMRDLEIALNDKLEIDPATVLPPEYHEFLDVFSKAIADRLPKHRTYNHTILLEEGKEPPF